MTDSSEFANNTEPTPEAEVGGEGWSGSDIEEAYLKALQAMEDIPWEEGAPAQESAESPATPQPAEEAVQAEASTTGDPSLDDAPAPANESLIAVAETPISETPVSEISITETPLVAIPVDSPAVNPIDATPAAGPRLAKGTRRAEQDSAEQRLDVSPAQVIEAALFVGGGPLTARKICGFLRGSYETKDVEQTIDKLNDDYVAQARPYEIRLGEGGYRLELQPE